MASKMFEHCLLPFLYLSTLDRQFGFKKGVGCLNSMHIVCRNVNKNNLLKMVTLCNIHYVNLSVIDLRKAFDKTRFCGFSVCCKTIMLTFVL